MYSIGDLGFAVGTQEIDDALLANFRKALSEPMRQLNRHGHQFGRLVAGKTEHQALVAGAACIHAHGDVGRLLLNGGDYAAGLGIEAVLRSRIANIADDVAGEVGEVNIGRGGNFTGDDDEAGGDERLAGYAALGVVRQYGVKDGVGNLVGYLVRVALGDRLRGKQKSFVGVRQNSVLRSRQWQSGGQTISVERSARQSTVA